MRAGVAYLCRVPRTSPVASYEVVNFIYLSDLLGLPVVNASGAKRIGRIVDLAASTGQVYPKVTGFIIKVRGRKEPVYVPWNLVRRTTFSKHVAIDYSPDILSGTSGGENEILLKRSFLDRQLISTSGYKVVRVNDLHLLIDNTAKESPNLWLVHVDVGIRGLLRRLGLDHVVNAIVHWIIARDIRDEFVPWKHIQPTTTTNVFGSLQLKTDSSKLSEIHPADLADILEDLGIDERISLLESLDNATAAATLQEMPIKLRSQIAEALDIERFAGIVNEMHMDETVDLLDSLDPEKRTAVFHMLNPEKVSEIEELSRLSVHRVGSIMNTDFIIARVTQTAREVLKAVKAESWKTELIYYVYIVDDSERLKGVLTLRHLLVAKPGTFISEIMSENPITVSVDTSIKRVAKIFFKYNFRAVPVVDEEQRVVGIVSMKDTLEAVFPEIREESKG
jgi:magnesium transporter